MLAEIFLYHKKRLKTPYEIRIHYIIIGILHEVRKSEAIMRCHLSPVKKKTKKNFVTREPKTKKDQKKKVKD